MENISFVLWLILYPLSIAIEKYIYRALIGNISELTAQEALVTMIAHITIWVGIATLLYVPLKG